MYFSYSFIIGLLCWFFASCSNPTSKEPEIDPEIIRSVKASGIDSLKIQQTTFPSNQQHTFIGEQGTLLEIPESAFQFQDGSSPKGEVSLSLIEANTMEDLVKGRISTLADGRLLSTGGTVFIEAKADNKLLSLKPDKALTITFPTVDKKEGMMLFEGEIVNNDINWKVAADSQQTPLRRPTPPKLTKPEGYDMLGDLYDIRLVRSILASVDSDEYLVEKGKHVPVGGGFGKMSWSTTFITACRNWLRYQEQKEAVLVEIERKYLAAKTRQAEAFKKYEVANVRYLIKEKPKFYRFQLSKMGWFNCDKFQPSELMTAQGEVRGLGGKPIPWARVHLISEVEQVHVTTTAGKDGRFSLSYIGNSPFEIHVFRKNLSTSLEVAEVTDETIMVELGG